MLECDTLIYAIKNVYSHRNYVCGLVSQKILLLYVFVRDNKSFDLWVLISHSRKICFVFWAFMEGETVAHQKTCPPIKKLNKNLKVDT